MLGYKIVPSAQLCIHILSLIFMLFQRFYRFLYIVTMRAYFSSNPFVFVPLRVVVLTFGGSSYVVSLPLRSKEIFCTDGQSSLSVHEGSSDRVDARLWLQFVVDVLRT